MSTTSITPELHMAFVKIAQKLIDDQQSKAINSKIDEQLNKELNKLTDKVKGWTETAIALRVESFSSEFLDQMLKEVLSRHISQTQNKLQGIDSKIDEMYRSNMPVTYTQKFTELFNRVVQCETELVYLRNTVKEFMETSFIQIVSDEDIKKLYLQSGLSLKDIQAEFQGESSRASRLINGEIKDPITRHKLKLFLLKAIKK